MARETVQLMHYVWQFIQSGGCLTITILNPVAVTSVKKKQQNNKQQDTEAFPIPILIPIIVTDDQNP